MAMQQRLEIELCAECGEEPIVSGGTDCIRCCAKRMSMHSQFATGDIIAERYEIAEMIGIGGWGVVYRGTHLTLRKEVAVKIMHANLCVDPDNIARFTAEAMTVARLQHPGIAATYDCGVLPNGQPYMVMELIIGTSLTTLLKQNVRIDPLTACNIFRQACEALDHAHKHGVIHRDVKPSNLLLVGTEATGYQLKLVDFGLAHLADSGENLTRTGQTVGTPAYMSPEQCQGHKVDARADVYSLACVFFEALTGTRAVDGTNMYEYMLNHIQQSPRPFPQFQKISPRPSDMKAPAVYAALQPVLLRALAKEADERYPSAAKFADAIFRAESFASNSLFSRLKLKLAVTGARSRSVKVNRLQLLTVVLLAAVLILPCAYFLSSQAPKAPAIQVESLNWSWMTLPVEAKPLGFADSLRKARYFVAKAKNGAGDHDPAVIRRRQKLAGYLLNFGCWDEAIEQLKQARMSYAAMYGEMDSNVLDVNSLIGDCYVQKKDFERAREAYVLANANLTPPLTGRDDSLAMRRLKLAMTELKLNEVDRAEQDFKSADVREESLPLVHTIAMCGMGDCKLLSFARGGTKDPSALRDAENWYQLASQKWGEFSTHDAKVASLRIADVFILQSNWEAAEAIYAKALTGETVFSESELATIKQNYARILWRLWRPLEAMKVEEQEEGSKHTI